MKSKFIAVIFFSIASLCNAQSYTYIYTPNDSPVYVDIKPELSPEQIADYTLECYTLWPNAEILAPSSRTYNCHSYAWYMIEGGTIICWMPYPGEYWEDESYEETTEEEAVKIFYAVGPGGHSAVKSATHPGKYESKWGELPLMRHSPEYGPYDAQYRIYYKCTEYVNILDETISADRTATSCGNAAVECVTVQNGATLTIKAAGDINVWNVTVKDGSKLILETAGTVTIISDFEIEPGSVFEIK